MAGHYLEDVHALAELGSVVKVLLDQLDSGAMDSEKFILEVREAVKRAEIV